MPKATKQSDRKADKKAKNAPVDEPEVSEGGSGGRIGELGKTLILGSVLAEFAPKLPNLVKDGIAIMKGEAKPEQPKAEKAEEEKEEEKEANGPETNGHIEKKNEDVQTVFNNLCDRLHWSNSLGLGVPTTAKESLDGWVSMKKLKVDFGPRAKKRGNPAMERISSNLCMHLPRYVHVLFFLMIARAFLLRSFFACLPWLTIYQLLSVLLPQQSLEKLPQVPLEKIPTELRVAVAVGINGLLMTFFLYELVWLSYFYEKFLVIGLVVYHSYAVAPVE